MNQHIQDFLDAAAQHGIAIADPEAVVADDTIRRLHMVGDKRGKPSVSYQLGGDDEFAYGWITGWKVSGEAVHWHSKPPRGQTQKCRKLAKERADANRAARDVERQRVREEGQREIARVWADAFPAVSHAYLERKGLSVHPDLRESEGILLIPMMRDGDMVGMQTISESGVKLFKPGSDTAGSYCDITGDPDTVVIAEGYATGLRIWEVTGYTVRVAFTAGQMAAVTVGAREHFTGARLIVAADNDQWTFKGGKCPADVSPRDVPGDDPRWQEWRDEGMLHNVGIEAAKQAAGKAGGCYMVAPTIPADDAGKGTDFDDMARLLGTDAVKDVFDSVPVSAPEDLEYIPPVDDSDWEDIPEPANVSHYERVMQELRPQGYLGKKYYFFPRSTGDIEEMSTADLKSDLNLYHMARQSFYMSMMDDPEKATGKDVVTMFAPVLMEMCKDKGKFDPERVRSVGVWCDGSGDIVANLGMQLYIPGRGFVDHADYEGKSVYVSAPNTVDIDIDPLSSAESVKLRYICESLSWKYGISGSLLAGWIYASILSGVLRWRPHIFITGQKGSGKSSVIERVVRKCLDGWSVNEDGGTTEAGFRRKLGNRARPVVSDEMEGGGDRQKNVDSVFFLARKSSIGAEYSNAYVDITVHSCFCFGAIIPSMTEGADQDRITVMELVPDTGAGARQKWKSIERDIRSTITRDFSRALIRRAIDNANNFLQNVEVFEDELSELLGSARSAEQFAPMVAGLYALHSTGLITPERARNWVSEQDWQFFHESDEGSDSEKLVAHLMTSLVEYQVLDRNTKASIADLIKHVLDDGPNMESARIALGRYGFRVEDGWLLIANSKSRINDLLRGTVWTVHKNSLGRYPGAEKGAGPIWFGAGVTSRYIKIPLEGLVSEYSSPVEVGFEDEDEEPF